LPAFFFIRRPAGLTWLYTSICIFIAENKNGFMGWIGKAIVLLCVCCGNGCFGQEGAGKFNRPAFYNAMAGKSQVEIDYQLDLLKVAGIPDQQAYEGALLMKKAGLAAGAKKKLSLFKEGHKKLEPAIQKDSTKAELRFLRLMIQEHAPGILGYKNDLNRDTRYIKDNFKRLPAAVQEAVREYSKKSIFLQPSDF
jgi:hypothetical protein